VVIMHDSTPRGLAPHQRIGPVLLALAGLLLPALALANAGDLDTTFGNGGKALLDFGGELASASAVGIGKDGKIYAAGSFKEGFGSTSDFLVVRLTPGGQRDPTWGGTPGHPSPGFVTTDFGGDDEAFALAIQKDGKVLVGGISQALDPPHTPIAALARYMPDGSLDTSFGTGGKLINTDDPVQGAVDALALQKDGKIVVAGEAIGQDVVVRLLPDGKPDDKFGAGGFATVDFRGSASEFFGLAVQADGKIVAVGYEAPNGVTDHFVVARLLKNGKPDPSFGNGANTTSFVEPDFGSGNSSGFGVAVQSDGKIVAAGEAIDAGTDQFALTRLKKNGRPDTFFGTQGIVTTTVGSSLGHARAVAIDRAGRIVAAGPAADNPDENPLNIAVARYTKKGFLDTTFGTSGKALTATGLEGDVRGLALQKDGKIVVGGFTIDRGQEVDIIARYLGK
jgi:uncharacterized delta-60 repeat protein